MYIPLEKRIRKHRWNLASLSWWKPVAERHKLASGPYGGWHCWWGPFHFWSLTTHNNEKKKGFTWR